MKLNYIRKFSFIDQVNIKFDKGCSMKNVMDEQIETNINYNNPSCKRDPREVLNSMHSLLLLLCEQEVSNTH